MKIKNNTILCVFALTTLAAGFGSCQSEDDVLNGLPQGSVPLVLGDVTVAGAQNVNNRAAGGNTRAAITEDPATGYTGIRKSRFVNGDVLNLTLTNGTGGSGGSTTSVTATLTGGKWVLTPGKVFITPGVTEISATHTATEQTAGIATDNLAAANADCTLTAATGTLAIAMKHAGAMIDITPGATDGATITSVTVNTDVPTAPEEEAVAGGSGTTMHYRTLTADATVVSSISAVIGGTTYVATLATPITVAANKRYPVALTFKHQTLTATPSAPQDWTDGGTVKPAGYTYIIDSPEALAQFAWDVNNTVEAGQAIALQTADIDLSKLKPAAEAGTNPMTGTAYTYTVTADNWSYIGETGDGFQGTYNGNGYTISNLKSTDGHGLFCNVTGGTLTGIHLRNVNSRGPSCKGCLANKVKNSTISLCSATGTLQSTNIDSNVNIGGLIGEAWTSNITRCSSDVDVTTDASNSAYIYAGGLIGQCSGGTLAGCIVTGDVTNNGSSTSNSTGGLIGYFNNSGTKGNIFGCLATGNVTKTSGEGYALLGNPETGSVNVSSCFATGSGYDFSASIPGVTYSDCAYTGTQTSTVSGVTGSVATADLYATLTANGTDLADQKTLHWSAADGYTLTPVTRTWYAIDVWKDNGTAAPTLDMSYEGWDGKYEGQTPNELAISGQTEYWVAPALATNAAGSETMTWDEAMAAGVCPKGWHIPTRDELDTMFGANVIDLHLSSNVFGDHTTYWTTTEVPGETDKAYYFIAGSIGEITTTDMGNRRSQAKTKTDTKVRCVRKK